MPARKKVPKHDIFISFIHEEEGLAIAVKKLLQRDFPQLEVFLSYHLHAGDDWLESIRRALSSAKVVILLLSKKSVRRPWINFEAGAGWLTKKKKVIPVTYGGLKKIPEPYGRLHAINLEKKPGKLSRDIDEYLQSLLQPKGREEIRFPPLPFLKWKPTRSIWRSQTLCLRSQQTLLAVAQNLQSWKDRSWSYSPQVRNTMAILLFQSPSISVYPWTRSRVPSPDWKRKASSSSRVRIGTGA